jgi:D-glycero-D-manno-heptose 1,7-bisphosphate phosphatase
LVDMFRSALFLDRDGVINEDISYVYRPSQTEFVPGIFDLARRALSSFHVIVVVTNQAGIGRGYFSTENFLDYTAWLHRAFEIEGVPIDRTYYCPAHPTSGAGRFRKNSIYRKPNPGMILKAAADIGIDLRTSTLVGDNLTDIEAARSAGVGRYCLLDRLGSWLDIPYRVDRLNDVELYQSGVVAPRPWRDSTEADFRNNVVECL